MIEFFHAQQSRSGRVLWLLKELGADFTIIRTDIPRQDGSGARDPNNPHPEGKVPTIKHHGALVTETSAIMLYLTDLFDDRQLGFAANEPRRGEYLTWLFWYGSVMEPVYHLEILGVADHPIAQATYRGRQEVEARLSNALSNGPWLMGDRFTAADILCCSPYLYFPDDMPEQPEIQQWVDRCTNREAYRRSLEED